MVLFFALSALAGDPRVVGGRVAAPDVWPDAAGVVFDDRDVGCTGVLVAPDVVLTAGHCAGGITDVVLDTVDYQVDGEWLEVDREIEYPSSWSNYDITVLILETPSTQTPRTIATGCVLEKYLYDGAPVTIVGFGAYDQRGNLYDSQLREAFTVVTDADCSDISSGCNRSVSPGGELGAGGGGVDACFGDSGGPLYLNTPDGDFLVGLTSRGYDGVNPPCALGGIYVRPDAVFDWIESVSGRTLPTPTCSDTVPENHLPVPTAEAIEVDVRRYGYSQIEPNDPDPWQHHLYALVGEATLGEATMPATGKLSYLAGDVPGTETLEVTVTDTDGGVATVQIEVTVVDPNPPDPDPVDSADEEDEKKCGCDATSSPLPLAWLGVLLLARRRQTRA